MAPRPAKRKAAPEPPQQNTSEPTGGQYKDSTNEIQYGIILRKYYPPEMTIARAGEYNANKIERPIEALEKAIQETQTEREGVKAGKSVVHWFKCDTRTMDNRGLHLASEEAKRHQIPLICVYLVSPQDFEAHLTAPVRVDFILRNLQVLKKDLATLDIPLYVETVEKRRTLPSRLIELCASWGASHIYCNIEYEVDELRREAALTRACLDHCISFNPVADTCVVEPGQVLSNQGGAISVYSPWYNKWCDYLNRHPEALESVPAPDKNPPDVRDTYGELFETEIPSAPAPKSLTDEEMERFHSMWPAGENEAHSRLEKFLREKIGRYHETRNLPGANTTSVLSPHLAAGTIAARTVVRAALHAGLNKKLTVDRNKGHPMWIGELGWRDFYRHVLCHWPYVW